MALSSTYGRSCEVSICAMFTKRVLLGKETTRATVRPIKWRNAVNNLHEFLVRVSAAGLDEPMKKTCSTTPPFILE